MLTTRILLLLFNDFLCKVLGYCALHEPQGNPPGVILGRVPRITHISSFHNLYNCIGCNNVNITIFLPKSERSKLVFISQIAVFLFFFFLFILQYVLFFMNRDKMKGDTDRIKDQGGKTRRKPIVEHEEQKIHKK